MVNFNFSAIITEAWFTYDDENKIVAITDVSAQVSTNHVFKVEFEHRNPVYAKLSYYGLYEHFREDHVIINNLANNLETPYENFLARSLVKDNEVFIYRYTKSFVDAWVIFYNPIKIKNKMPRRLDEKHIVSLAHALAYFHKSCFNIRKSLPKSSKTLQTDISQLKEIVLSNKRCDVNGYEKQIIEHCDTFFENSEKLGYNSLNKIAVFIDWNIGNFSVTNNRRFYSRWDYDWFRVANRVMDFYFFSRVVSSIGDRTVFSYLVEPMQEDRFLLFLQEYHKVYPLEEKEVLFLKEVYRFFILNYVIKDGRYFFHDIYSKKLLKEAFDIYLPSIDTNFDINKILKALNF